MQTHGFTLIYTRELRANLKSLLSWALPVAALVAFAMSLQPSMATPDSLMAAKLQMMPESMRAAFSLPTADFHKPAPYMAMAFLYVTLTSAIFAGLLGANLLAKEEMGHTAETLLTLPVSRGAIFAGKLAVAVTFAAVYELIQAVAGIGTLAAVVEGDLQLGLLLQMYVGAGLLAVTFAAVGFLANTVVKEARSANGLTLGLVLGTYLLGMLAATGGKAANAKYFSPYKLVEPKDVVEQDGLQGPKVALLVLVAVAAAAVAFVRWQRKDIHA